VKKKSNARVVRNVQVSGDIRERYRGTLMRCSRTEICAFVTAVTLCLSVLSFSPSGRAQSAQSPKRDTAYFPSELDHSFAPLFAEALAKIDEPSLMTAANDHTLLSYRSDSLGFMTGMIISTRLSVNPDGTGRVYITDQSLLNAQQLHRAQADVSAADVKVFLDLVEKSDFWLMPAEAPEVHPSHDGRETYTVDGAVWCMEGARNGNFHAVLRRNPDPSSFTEMVDFLRKNLAARASAANSRSNPAPK
jgi:hypothetical protein